MILTDNFNDSKAIEEAYGQNMDSVVLIVTEGKKGQKLGTGIFINLPGRNDLRGRLVLTAAHVIDNGITLVIPNVRGEADMNNIPPQEIKTIRPKEYSYEIAESFF